MKNICLALLLTATLLLLSCGNDIKTDPTGTWTATLTPTQNGSVGNATAMSFNNTLTTNATPGVATATVTATNFKINTNNGCLAANAFEMASYTIDSTGNTFSMSIKSPVDASTTNDLDMAGTLTNNVINGNWVLSPSAGINYACTGSGTFTMELVSGSGFLPKHG